MKLQRYHFEIIAGVLGNLSAAWIFAAVSTDDFNILTKSLWYATISLLAAFMIRQEGEVYG